MGEFRLDCSFCDEVIESETVDTVKQHGRTHLEDRHDTALPSFLAAAYDIDECGGCESTFATDGEGAERFECPDCGYDNFRPLVRRYLYWQIETE